MPIGSNCDDFLKEEGLYELSTAAAIKKVPALQIEEAMKEQQLTKTAMAKRMHTSRAALNRLLDNTRYQPHPDNPDNPGQRCCGTRQGREG